MNFLLFRHGAVRAAANLRDMLGSIQKSKALAMSTQLLHGTLYGRSCRLCPSTSQMSGMPCRTSYTLSGNYILIILKYIIYKIYDIQKPRIIQDIFKIERNDLFYASLTSTNYMSK